MLTPAVWCIEGPDYALPAATVSEAADIVSLGGAAILPDYSSAISTLIRTGCPAERAVHLADVARKQPQHQETYVA